MGKVLWAEGERPSFILHMLAGDPLHGPCSVYRDSCDRFDLEGHSGGGVKDLCGISIKCSPRESGFYTVFEVTGWLCCLVVQAVSP